MPRVKPRIKPSVYWKFLDDWDKATTRGILRTCRFIYEEASLVFYEGNTFSFKCRWNARGECQTFDHLPSDYSFKSLRHLQLDIYRWFDSQRLLPVDIEATLRHVETFGCSLSTLRLRFIPTSDEFQYSYTQGLQPGPSQESQTEEEIIERVSNQIYRLGIKQKIEIEFAASPDRKAGCERVQGFVNVLAASKNWKSRKTTIACLNWWHRTRYNVGSGILINDPLPEAKRGPLILVHDSLFCNAYGETEEIVVSEDKIVEYKWKWLLQEKP
ncbi:MAG: hypothetical protein HETSPECPRED_004552 [Heterodermia speciosa]|uniref:Uncharacterized protein n=1 Tax=Heterodermia speciosa TaxID=116794 RepID=A0A8H3FBE5_9LECA|nr:MAG: hypothetical protein HETSPECPRED_004552 [Heterodermia speciosa]